MSWNDKFSNIKGRRRLTVVKIGLSQKEAYGWQNTDLTTLTSWHTDTGTKFILRTTGWNNKADWQIMKCLSLIGALWARSNKNAWGGLCKCLEQSFQEKI